MESVAEMLHASLLRVQGDIEYLQNLLSDREQARVDLLAHLQRASRSPEEFERLIAHSESLPAPLTIKERVLRVVGKTSRGWTPADIVSECTKRFGTEIHVKSLRPQLHRLRGDGLLEQRDGLWYDVEAFKKQ